MEYKLKYEKQNIKMDICSYFWIASKSSVVSSSSDSEDGNESEIDVQPNPPEKHCSSSTSKSPSKSGSGIRRYNQMLEETFLWLEFDENLQGAFCKLRKKGGRSLQRTGGAWVTKPFTNWKKVTQKMKSHSKSEVHFYPVNWTWKLIELEKKNPLLANFKMLESSNDYKTGG